MSRTAGRAGIAAAAALLALTAGMRVQDPGQSLLAPDAAAGAQLEEIQRGEALFRASCQTCHARRVIEVQAMSLDQWTATIHKMIENGADVAKDDIAVLAEYLTIFHGPVPDGPGKDVLLNTCTMCHDLTRIKFGPRSPEEWEETLVTMLNEGAPLSDEEFVLIHHYLSRHFSAE